MALFGEDLVTRTKFIAPQVKGAHIRRERLHRLLDGTQEVPLTVVVAGAGYGKSTLLAGYLEAAGVPGLWYELGERDADPQVIALHLAHLCHRAFPGSADRTLAALERPGGAAVHWAAAAEALADGLLDRVERHTVLVLALVEAFLGNADAARTLAVRGLERSRMQGAAWGEAVGLIRAGHAALVAGREREAEALYQKSLELAAAVGVDRLTAEPLVGLTVLAGRRSAAGEAERLAKRAAEAASKHGDTWMVALTQLGLGVAWATAGDSRAAKQLEAAEKVFGRVGDPHGELKARLWGTRLALAPAEGRGAAVRMAALASHIRDAALGRLLAGPTLLGFGSREQALGFLRDVTAAGTPGAVLVAALESGGVSPAEVHGLLAELGIGTDEEPDLEPAAGLRVRSLGAFRVWRGGAEIDRKAWGRKIALQLFHLLVVHRHEVLPKSRIIDMLWPDLEPGVADGTFRVALNTLNKTLEPDRPAGREPRYILRQGTAYSLRPGEDLWLDAAEFERLLDGATVMEAAGQDPAALLAQALDLSAGDFLAEFTEYGAWCDRERERLSVRFSDGAAKLARRLLERGDAAGCAGWAQRLVERDPCAELAYRLLMVAQYRQADRTGAIRTYERCVEALAQELDVEPMPETTAVYEAIVAMADPAGILPVS